MPEHSLIGAVCVQVLAKSDGEADDELLSVTSVKAGTLVSHLLLSRSCVSLLAKALLHNSSHAFAAMLLPAQLH